MSNSIIPQENNVKKCTLCGVTYPAAPEYYHRDKQGKFGLVARCKVCMANLQREYLKTKEGKATRRRYKQSEKGRESRRRYKRGEAGQEAEKRRRGSEARRMAQAKYRQSESGKQVYRKQRARYRNTPHEQSQRRKYFKSDSYKSTSRRYWSSPEGKEVRRAQNSRYRANKLSAGGSFTPEEFKALCKFYGNKCLCCKSQGVPLEADHVVPLSKGGSNDIGNIQPLCRSCNGRKADKTVDYR